MTKLFSILCVQTKSPISLKCQHYEHNHYGSLFIDCFSAQFIYIYITMFILNIQDLKDLMENI